MAIPLSQAVASSAALDRAWQEGAPGLQWLPPARDFDIVLSAAKRAADPAERLSLLAALCRTRLDYVQAASVDRVVGRTLTELKDANPPMPRLKMAVLGSSAVDHLLPAIRTAALRRGFALDLHTGGYGLVRQELLERNEALEAFGPHYILIAFHARALLPQLAPGDAAAAQAAAHAALGELRALWRAARDRFGATPIQQTVIEAEPAVFGLAEGALPGTRAAVVRQVNGAIAEAAAAGEALLLDLDRLARRVSIAALTDPTRWHQAKQEIAPRQAPLYGDAVARLVMAARGLSRKCLVLDLDNTLWGGIVGDDGLEGIRIGQGSPEGEAYAAFQLHLKQLAQRGVALAVASKNDPALALEAFERHPEMVLKRSDIAAFEASWGDKPAALQRIARTLEFSTDALAFLDDNPAERALVRQTLPEVAVPELPAAPELFAQALADSGWFDAVAFTAEDALRTAHYAADAQRRQAQETAADIDGFLDGLAMELDIAPLDRLSLARATQLINKTNQFNLTTRRTTETEMAAFAADPERAVLVARLRDRFGDNGLISVAIARLAESDGAPALDIETWVMSCRVFGRRVEFAMRDALAEAARAKGARWLLGRYRPTQRNGLVAELFPQLGFAPLSAGEAGATDWRLDLAAALAAWRSPFARARR
jgi:FkbH-like protein